MSSSQARRLPLVSSSAPRAEAYHREPGLLRLGMECNQSCSFCNVPAEDYVRRTPPADVFARELEELLASGGETLTLSGGEPTLHRDRLLSAVRRARSAGVGSVELETNAVLIDAEYARELAGAGLTSARVLLLSDRAELHDALAGRDGAFDACLAGIDSLLAQGVTVVASPVIAKATEARVVAYVDFVAQRLPAVRAISLSAVEPMGRGASRLELLPDYAVLGPEVRRARERAEAHGIELSNSDTGLPLCVGWDGHHSKSVEAKASESKHRGKRRHGEPCRRCALRTRCEGAWHAYFYNREGSGLAAPIPRLEPWDREIVGSEVHRVVATHAGLDDATLARLRQTDAPVVWLVVGKLEGGHGAMIRDSGATDLAVVNDVASLARDRATLSELLAIAERNQGLEPRAVLRTSVGLTRLGSFSAAFELLRSLARSRVEVVRLLLRGDERVTRFAEAAARELGIEVGVGEPAP